MAQSGVVQHAKMQAPPVRVLQVLQPRRTLATVSELLKVFTFITGRAVGGLKRAVEVKAGQRLRYQCNAKAGPLATHPAHRP